MLRSLKTALLTLAALATCGLPSRADVLYDSLTQSIQAVEAQAYVYLTRGRYVTENGRSRIIWNIPKDTRSTIRFRYAMGTIQEGTIDFQSGTSFLIRSGGLCSKITVRTISVLPGGAVDESNSNYTLDPPSAQCRQPRSQLEGALEDVLTLQIDPAKTFEGKVFAASDTLRRCPNEACEGPLSAMPSAQPVTKFTAFSTDRKNATSAFAAELRPGASLLLPNQAGYVKLASGSGVQILNATYDLVQKRGSGVMQKLRLNADEGVLNFGNAVMNLMPGSVLAFEDIAIAQTADTTSVTRGTLTGTLGGSSFLTIAARGAHKSLLSFTQASATMTGLNMEFRGSAASISGQAGDLKILANSADLYLSDDFRLLLGPTNLNLVFACPPGEPACRPFSWSKDGALVTVGHILPLATTLKGGFVTFPGQNQLQIDSGEIQTADLQLDSRQTTNPVVGTVQKLDLRISAQNWQIDKNLRIGAAALRLASQDLSMVAGDSYPVGAVAFTGQISEITASGIGRLPLVTADTQFSVQASRKIRDDLKIDDGTVDGKIALRGDDAQTGAKAAFSLASVLYYRGVGSGKLAFSLDEARAHVPTPSDHSENGFSGGRTVVDVSARDIALSLAKRVGFSGVDVRVNDGVWSIAEQKDLNLEVNAAVATGELVNITVQQGGGDLSTGYTTLCSPHLNINRGNYLLRAKADLSLSSTLRRFSVHDASMEPQFDADVDDRGCKLIAEGICGVIGGMLTGGFGAIAAGIACGREIDKYKKQIHEKVAGEADKKIRDLKFEPTF